MAFDGEFFMKKSGIYIVGLVNETPMPVTRDRRYVDTCAKMTWANVKVGKATDFAKRKSGYCRDFDEENIVFEPLVQTDDLVHAEKLILRALRKYRVLSPKGARLEWLEGIAYEDVKTLVLLELDKAGIKYVLATPESQ
jgi:hypothetical protein